MPIAMALILAVSLSGGGAVIPQSAFRVVSSDTLPNPSRAEIAVAATDPATEQPIPVRAIVTGADGRYVDGAGRGLYSDGRFFADGAFTVSVVPGRTRIRLSSGPSRVPLDFETTAVAGKRIHVRAELPTWYRPEEHGWFSGDNHVHTQHDPKAVIRSDSAYTALQARAQGLSFLTQASKNSADGDPVALDRSDFLFRNAEEIGVGAYVGHLTTPGIARPVESGLVSRASAAPLPVPTIARAVRELGGVTIYTHPTEPPQQLHWMGATEAYSDAVLGTTADAFDVDGPRSEMMWFALLNLGARLGISSYTDSALERVSTLSPGDRRVYCHAGTLDYARCVDALRQGRSFATDGGPVFAFLTVDGAEPGSVVRSRAGAPAMAHVEVRSLHPLRSLTLVRRGRTERAFDAVGRAGRTDVSHEFRPEAGDWVVARAQDDHGNWALTSPVYFGAPKRRAGFSAVAMIEIANATRMVDLRGQFFAHLIVTVGPGERLRHVDLMRDGSLLRSFEQKDGDGPNLSGVPVTCGAGEYSPGWVWAAAGRHLQGDWPVDATGWYEVRAVTSSGRSVTTDAILFAAGAPNSSEVCALRLVGPDAELTHWGYGEDMPLKDIRAPFQGDHWWYFGNRYWRLSATFRDETRTLEDGGQAHRFRPAGTR